MTDRWRKRFWKALDRAGNVVFYRGDDEETISHHVARARVRRVWWGTATCFVIERIIAPFYHPWRDHCNKVLADPNEADANFPIDAPLYGDANPDKK